MSQDDKNSPDMEQPPMLSMSQFASKEDYWKARAEKIELQLAEYLAGSGESLAAKLHRMTLTAEHWMAKAHELNAINSADRLTIDDVSTLNGIAHAIKVDGRLDSAEKLRDIASRMLVAPTSSERATNAALQEVEDALWTLHSYESNRDDAGRSYSEAEITKMVSAIRALAPNSATSPTKDAHGQVYCHACSVAGGAERPIYHSPPICSRTEGRDA